MTIKFINQHSYEVTLKRLKTDVYIDSYLNFNLNKFINYRKSPSKTNQSNVACYPSNSRLSRLKRSVVDF